MFCTYRYTRGARRGCKCNRRADVNDLRYCEKHYEDYKRRERLGFRRPMPISRKASRRTMYRSRSVENIIPVINNDYDKSTVEIMHINKLLHQLKIVSCDLCSENIDGPQVVLECNHKYHPKCYNSMKDKKKCHKCYLQIEKETDYPRCSICLDKITGKRIKTECNHSFHLGCITKWIGVGSKNFDKCPNCRTHLIN